MITLLGDIGYALRGLRKSPLFTCVALGSLAIGIGANTAVFSLMDQALLRSLPVQHPEQLVLFSAPGPRSGTINRITTTRLRSPTRCTANSGMAIRCSAA